MMQFTLVARGVLLGATLAMAGLGASSEDARAAPPDPAPKHHPSRLHRMSQARLGIVPLAISPELRKHLGAPEDRGVLVDRVAPGTPAARADIRVGDVVISVDGDDVTTRDDIVRALSDRQAHDLVTVMIVRDRVTILSTSVGRSAYLRARNRRETSRG